jgi:YcxB-like protein
MSDSRKIEVTATLGMRDLQRANFSIARSATKWGRSLLFSIAISALLFPALSLAYRDDKGLVWMAVIGVVFGIALWLVLTPLMIVVAYVLSFFTAHTLVRNNPHALGPITYQFSESGYTYSAPNGKGETLWTAYPKIHETHENFLFFFVKHLATVLPKRCFHGEPAIQEFRGLLERNYRGELRLLSRLGPD